MKMVSNIKKKIKGVMVAVITVGFIGVGFGVGADNVSNTILDAGTGSSLTNITGTSITAVGGKVTSVNISTNISTTKWQGFYGSLSGNVLLGAGTDIFHNFGSVTFSSIFVSTGTGPTWSSLIAGTAASVDTAWSFTSGDQDSTATTFPTSAGTFAGIGSVPGIGIGNFNMGLLKDGAGTAKANHVFVADVGNAAGFDGSNYDYQVIVPVDSSGTETYYFYASLE